MTHRTERPVLLRAASELLLWFAMAAAFLVAYVGRNALSFDTVTEHLRVFGASVCALLLLRLASSALLPGWLARWGQAVLSTVFLLGWLFFYALVLVGLHYWGEVITLSILGIYALQASTLLGTLGVPTWVFVASLLLVFGLTAKGLWWQHAPSHWTAGAARQWGWSRLTPLALGAAGLMAIEGLNFHLRLGLPTQEPVALTLRTPSQLEAQRLGASGKTGERLRQLARLERDAYRTSANPVQANVILIVVDALRDDHLAINGYNRATTPHLQRWIEKTGGVSLKPTRSSCSSSVCGISGLITSRFVHEQIPGALSLHEVLSLHGWRSHLLLGGDHTNFYGLRERYGRVDSYIDGSHAAPALLNDDRFLIESLGSIEGDGRVPAFIHFHLMSAHVLGKRFLDNRAFGPSFNYSNPSIKLLPDAASRAINYYDQGVLQTDHVIDKILLALEAKGMLKNALVIITGDHGEHLGEQGLYSHANGIFEPAVRVPWIMLPFGLSIPPMVTASRLHHVDMAPTVLDLLKIKPPAGWVGVSLLANDRSGLVSYLSQGPVIGLVDHRSERAVFKYSVDVASGEERIFNLSDDPAERRSVSAPSQDVLETWRRLMLVQVSEVASWKR